MALREPQATVRVAAGWLGPAPLAGQGPSGKFGHAFGASLGLHGAVLLAVVLLAGTLRPQEPPPAAPLVVRLAPLYLPPPEAPGPRSGGGGGGGGGSPAPAPRKPLEVNTGRGSRHGSAGVAVRARAGRRWPAGPRVRDADSRIPHPLITTNARPARSVRVPGSDRRSTANACPRSPAPPALWHSRRRSSALSRCVPAGHPESAVDNPTRGCELRAIGDGDVARVPRAFPIELDRHHPGEAARQPVVLGIRRGGNDDRARVGRQADGPLERTLGDRRSSCPG